MSLANLEPGAISAYNVSPSKLLFRTAYAKFSLVLLIISFVSLLPQYHNLLTKPETVSPALIIHGLFFFGWYILFTVQSSLTSSGQVALHMKLGYWSIVLGLILAFSGTLTMVNVMRADHASWSHQLLASRTSVVWATLHTLVTFVGFYSLAIFYRRRTQLHKRFMLLAALSMMSASVSRIGFLPFVTVDGTTVTLLITYALLITPVVIDRVQQQRVHPVLKWGVPAYIVTQFLCIGLIPATEIGRKLAFPF